MNREKRQVQSHQYMKYFHNASFDLMFGALRSALFFAAAAQFAIAVAASIYSHTDTHSSQQTMSAS